MGMETELGLNPDDSVHLFALHYVFLPRINQRLGEFIGSWNRHPISTASNRSPRQMWLRYHMLHGPISPDADDQFLPSSHPDAFGASTPGDGGLYQPREHEAEINTVLNPLSAEHYSMLQQQVDPLRTSNMYGIDVFHEALNYTLACLAESDSDSN
jgi:hypothetical protein